MGKLYPWRLKPAPGATSNQFGTPRIFGHLDPPRYRRVVRAFLNGLVPAEVPNQAKLSPPQSIRGRIGKPWNASQTSSERSTKPKVTGSNPGGRASDLAQRSRSAPVRTIRAPGKGQSDGQSFRIRGQGTNSSGDLSSTKPKVTDSNPVGRAEVQASWAVCWTGAAFTAGLVDSTLPPSGWLAGSVLRLSLIHI